jgi:hypothetical protein
MNQLCAAHCKLLLRRKRRCASAAGPA